MTVSLTYFDFDGSRGLECRLALHLAGVTFEDVRVNREQFRALKPDLPFGSAPVLSWEGKRLPQTNAILTFVGRAHGLHPSDPWRAAEHQALMLSVEDLRKKMPSTKGLSDDEKRSVREDFAGGWLTRWAHTVSENIRGPFLEGEALSVADIKLYVILRAFMSDTYDHIPGSFFDAFPELVAHFEGVTAAPKVVGYWATRKGA